MLNATPGHVYVTLYAYLACHNSKKSNALMALDSYKLYNIINVMYDFIVFTAVD